jgi:hypothetical protein
MSIDTWTTDKQKASLVEKNSSILNLIKEKYELVAPTVQIELTEYEAKMLVNITGYNEYLNSLYKKLRNLGFTYCDINPEDYSTQFDYLKNLHKEVIK